MPRYKVNNKVYNIPDDNTSANKAFKDRYPNATVEIFDNGGQKYNLPLDRVDAFQKKFDKWSYTASPAEEQATDPVAAAPQHVPVQRDSSPNMQADIQANLAGVDVNPQFNFDDEPTELRRPESRRLAVKKANKRQDVKAEALRKQFEDSGALEQIAEIENRAQKTLDENKVVPNVANPLTGSGALRIGNEVINWAAGLFNKETRAARATKTKAEEVRDMVDEAGHADNGFWDKQVGGTFRGLEDGATRVGTWDFGATGIADAAELNSVYKKYQAGEELSSNEQDMLDMMGLAAAAQQAYGGQLGIGYQVGQSLPESAGFMVSMAANPAGGLAKKAVQKFGTTTARKIAARALGDIAEMGIMTVTTGAGRVAEDYFNRVNGSSTYDIDENGIIRYGGQVDQERAAAAIFKALGSQFIENYSEAVGEYFEPIGGFLGNVTTKGLKKIHLDAFADALQNIKSSQWSKAIDAFAEKTKFNGTLGEYMEEVVGNVMNAATVGDMTFALPGREGYEQSVFNAETNLTTLLSCALMSGAINGTRAGGSYIERSSITGRTRRADAAAESAWGDGWAGLRDRIDLASPSERVAVIQESLKGATPEQQRAVLDYAVRRTIEQEYNARTAANREEMTDEAKNAMSAYDNGYHRTSMQSMNAARNNFEYRRRKMAAAGIGQNVIEAIDNDPFSAVETVRENQMGWTPEQQRTALDYIYAKQTFDGVLQRVRDDIQGRIDVSDANIDSRTHRTSGKVQGAAMTDGRQVYVIGGNVSATDDGSGVNVAMSDESVIIRDAQTGKMEQVSPKDIVSLNQPMSPDEMKTAAADLIRRQDGQQAADNIDGKVILQSGQQLPFTDEEGNQHIYTVILDDGGENIAVTEDGKNKEYVPRSYFQQQADEAGIQAVADFDAQNEAQRQQQAAEAAAQRQPSYKRDDTIRVRDASGTEATGIIRSDADEDGLYLVETTIPINGKEVQEFTADQLNAIVISHNNVPVVQNAQQAADLEQQTGQAAEILPQSPAASEQIPTDENGNPIYEQSTPDLAWDSIVEQAGDEAIAQSVAEDMLKDKKAALKAAERAPLGKGTTVAEKIAAQKAKQQMIDAAKADVAFWEDVVATNQRRAEEAEKARIEAESKVDENRENNGSEGAPGAVAETNKEASYVQPNTRPSLLNVVKDLFEKGKEYASELYQRSFFDVADTPDFMKALGLSGDKFTIKYGVIARHFGKDISHDLTEKDWEQLPDALQHPFAITRRTDADNSYRIYTALRTENGEYVVVGVDVKKAGREIEVNAISTVFGRRNDAHLPQNEEEIYRSDEITPEQSSLLDRPNSYQYPTEQGVSANKDSDSQSQSNTSEEKVAENPLDQVPDVVEDSPEAARARGFRRVDGHRIDRQEAVPHLEGKEVSVKFSNKVLQNGRVAVIDASQLQPSHLQGQVNHVHFLDEAQPKDRADATSAMAAQRIARNVRPEEITSSVTAYTGAPSVNARGEVIQGNNRADALRYMWGSEEESAARYKQYLMDHADEFGLNADEIAAMEAPVLVNMFDVNDNAAIELGQYVASDTESGGTERIRPKNAVQKMGDDMKLFAEQLLDSGGDEEMSFAQLLDRNAYDVLHWMNQQGYITPTQYASAFDTKGNITADAKNDLKAIMFQSIFRGANRQLEEMFNRMPAKAQKAILSTAYRDYGSPSSESMIGELQDSIRAFDALMNEQMFQDAKNWKDAMNAVEIWAVQYVFDDVTGDSYLPSDKFSNFALHLAAMYKGDTQKKIQGVFNEIYDLVQGAKEDNLFEEADKTPRTLAEAISETLNIEYNGQRNGSVLGSESQTGTERQPGGTGDNRPGESAQGGEGTSDNSGGTSELRGQKPVAPHDYFKENYDRARKFLDRYTKEPIYADAVRSVTKAAAHQIESARKDVEAFSDGKGLPGQIENAGAALKAWEQAKDDILQELKEKKEAEDTAIRAKKEDKHIVSDSRMAELKRRMREKLGQLNMGVDPELLAIGTELAVGHIERGAKKFVDFTKAMIADLGDAVRPYLKSFYNAVRDMPEAQDYAAELTPYEEVRAFDVATIGENGEVATPSIFDTAEQITNEETVRRNEENLETTVSEETESNGAYTIAPAQYTTKKGKVLDMFLVSPAAEMGKEAYKAASTLARDMKGWYDAKNKGFMLRSEEDARKFAGQTFSSTESEKDAPIAQVDVEGLFNNLKTKGEAKLSDHSTPLMSDNGTSRDEQVVRAAVGKIFENSKGHRMNVLGIENGRVSIAIKHDGDVDAYTTSIPELADALQRWTEVEKNDKADVEKPGFNLGQFLDEMVDSVLEGNQMQRISNIFKNNPEGMARDEVKKIIYNSIIGVVSKNYNESKADGKLQYFLGKEGKQNTSAAAESILDDVQFRAERFAEKQREKETKARKQAILDRHNAHIGDKYLYNGKEVTLHDVDEFGDDAVLDTGLAPVLYEVIEFDKLKPINNNGNEQSDEITEQERSDSRAIASEAEAVASKAESDVEAATTEGAVNETVTVIDDKVEQVNDQLALLGYYKADPNSPDHESLGHMRSAEALAVKDANNLAAKLIRDLGIDPEKIVDKKGKKVKKVAKANLAPIGGDITLHLPLTDDAGLYINVDVERQMDDSLKVTNVLYRIDRKDGKYGYNNFMSVDTKYADLLKEVKRLMSDIVPDFEPVEAAEVKLAAKSRKSADKSSKNTAKETNDGEKTVSSQSQTDEDFIRSLVGKTLRRVGDNKGRPYNETMVLRIHKDGKTVIADVNTVAFGGMMYWSFKDAAKSIRDGGWSEDNTVEAGNGISQDAILEDLFGGVTEETKPEAKPEISREEEKSRRTFVERVKSEMLAALDTDSKPFRSINDIRKKAAQAGMQVDNEGRSDILLQELVEDGLVRAAREIIHRTGRDTRESFDLVCKLYDMQPTIAQRSSNRIKMQQYSTPLPMAWAANRFAMQKDNAKVLEPTAGNGMLVFTVPFNQVQANELDPTRAVNLMEQGFPGVWMYDATEPFRTGKAYDAVIANPPFGSSEAKTYDGKEISGLDPQITLNALESMKDNGRAAIIIGGNNEYNPNGSIKNNKAFLTYLYDHYNVKGIVDMAGSLYAKQGTTFPTRMILIEGRRSEEEREQTVVYPPVKDKAIRKAETFDDLYDIINEVINSKDKTNGYEVLRSGGQRPQPVIDNPSGRTDGERHNQQPRKDDSKGRGTVRRAGTGVGVGRSSQDVLRQPRQDASVGETSNEAGTARESGNVGGRSGQRAVGARSGRLEDVAVRRDGVGLKTPVEHKKRTLTEEKLPYRSHNSAFSLESVAPAAMVEAMDNILTQIEKEEGNIDEFITRELGYSSVEEAHNALAAEQMDSVAMAIYQMKHGQALIIGDQTGVGKGRQMAALIRWGVNQGKKPIFFTQKADLFSDIYRDLADIGSGDLVPFIFNSASSKENKGEMVDANGKTVYKALPDAKMKAVLATGELPDGYDYAVLTYSQINSGDGQSQKEAKENAKKSGQRAEKSKSEGKATPKATFLRNIALDNYLLLDESHTAAGQSNTGAYLQSLLKSAKAATFASATFAKRPDTMPMYALRTAMSQAKVEPTELINIIQKGGVTLQEIMSRELTNAGQMVRRERDMTGVKTDWKTIDDPETTKRARDNYDRTIRAFNAIIQFQETFVKPMIEAKDKELAQQAKTANIKRGTNKLGVQNVPFASKTYNYTKQLMLALKVDAIADEVEKEIKTGRHPVIALESTMESSLDGYNPGDVIARPTFSASLLKGLDTVMQYTVKDENGKEHHEYYSPKDLGPDGEKAYHDLQQFILDSTSDIFISPLDAIIERLHEKGYKVGEMTGRDKYVEKNEKGQVVVRKRTDKDKKKMQRDFNSGALDVLILNKSASTGISLHASTKFSDQRQRSMIIAQPLSDINDYMQMIGRIDRTGQVSRGYYINLGLPVPAENRFLMMLSTKLKSLNANTTTSQDNESNDVEAPDLLNKYGSQVIVEYLRDNQEIYEKLGRPFKSGAVGEKEGMPASKLDEYQAQEDDARRVTGYVALLSTKEQEDFYTDVVRRYNDLIRYLNDTGTNDLKINVMPLRAKTLSRKVSSQGLDPEGNNPFAKDSYVEEVEIDVLRKPMKAEEIRKVIDQINGEEGEGVHVAKILETIDQETKAKIEAENEKDARLRAKAVDDIAKKAAKINSQETMEDKYKAEAIEQLEADAYGRLDERHNNNLARINGAPAHLRKALGMFVVGKTYRVPDVLDSQVFDFAATAVFCGYKAKESKITESTTFAVFATLDGRRRVEVKLSDATALETITNLTRVNWDATRSTTLDNWDSQIPTETRKKGYIMTGNILQAIADVQDERGGYPGQLISYTDIDGNVHDGILMPDKWSTSMLRNSGAPITSRMNDIKEYKTVVSQDGKVTIEGSRYAGMYYLSVPKTKKEGAQFFENKVILDAARYGEFNPYRGKFRADIPASKIEAVVKELAKLGVKVKEELSQDDAVITDNERFRTSEELDTEFGKRWIEEQTNMADGRHTTQVKNTLNSYRKFADWVKKDSNGRNVSVLDASSGLGLGTQHMRENGLNADDVEPYASSEREAPTFSSYADIDKKYDYVISNAVLNVIPDDWRADVLHDMADVLKAGGKLVINVRSAKSIEQQGTEGKSRITLDSPSEILVTRPDGSIRAYQKGFTKEELRDWARRELGEGYEVEIANNTNAGSSYDTAIVVTKIDTNVEELNNNFNENLQRQIDKELPAGFVYELGLPSAYLQSVGIERLPITLNASILNNKSNDPAHPYSLEEVKDLVKMIQKPIAIFQYGDKKDARNLMIGISQPGDEGKQFLVGLFIRPNVKGKGVLEINSIRNVFPKNYHDWIHWVNQGKMMRADGKEEIQAIINALRINPVDYIDKKDLDSATKIIKDFENPSLPSENSADNARMGSSFGSRTRDTAVAKRKRAEELVQRLNLKNVEIRESVDGLEGKRRRAKGFFTRSTGKITIVLSNHSTVADVEQTLLHEAVAHYGLRMLFGKDFDTFLDNVFRNASEPIRRKIVDMAAKNGWDFRTATEEYLAGLAENTNFEEAQKEGWWGKIKQMFLNMLDKLGFKGLNLGFRLRDNELRYILWASYQNLKGGKYGNIFNEAADITKQMDLKVGEFENDDTDPDGPDGDLFRDGSTEDYQRSLARARYEDRLRTGMYQAHEALQDSMLGLKEGMAAILGRKRLRIEEVDGFENAYLGENRLSSVNLDEANYAARTLFKPLFEEISKLAHNDTEREDLKDYMMAKHGLERNEYMAQKAFEEYQKEHPHGKKTLNDFRMRDYAGLTALTEEADVATAEGIARDMVDSYESNHDTTALWEKTNAISGAILRKSYESGFMNRETYDKISSMYEYYIPLRGFDEKTSEEAYAYLTSSKSAFNSPIRAARGRKSKADDPIATLQQMMESGIAQGNRNKLVKQKFLNFVLNHPSDLVSVSDLWIKKDAIAGEWVSAFPDNIEKDDPASEVERKMKEFDEKMRQLAEAEPDKYKKAKDDPSIPYRVVTSRELHEHQVVVKRNGRDYILTVNGNPRLAQTLNGQTNPDNDLSGAIGKIMKAGEYLNRKLSGFYTTKNLDFVLSNFLRDMVYTNSMVWVKEKPNYALRFNRNVAKVNPKTMLSLIRKYEKGTLGTTDPTEVMFRQFMQNGGETGYTSIRDIEQHKKDVEKEVRKANGEMTAARAWEYLEDKLDWFNRSVENCARFAAFVTSREMGRSIDRSIWDAKEVSVNFNKKGSGSKFMDANGQTRLGNTAAFLSGAGRTGFVFWNASVQGLANIGDAFVRNPKKAATMTTALFALGALIAYLGYDGDDDDKSSYFNLPEYVRRSNIMFRPGTETWVSIPLPIEFRAIYGMGELAVSAMSGKEHFTGGELGTAIASQVTQILPLDVMEGNGGFHALIPSSIKPLAEAISNKSWTGMPLYKDNPYNQDDPEWTKAYKSANKEIVWVTEGLNYITGGDRYTKGWLDLNPAKIEHVLSGYFGGLFSTADKLIKMGETLTPARDYDPRNFLLLNRVVKSGDERTEYRALRNEYFRDKEEHDRIGKRLRRYESDTDSGIFDYAEKIDFLYNSPEYARWEIFEEYKDEIKVLDDTMKESDPGSEDYKMAEADYVNLMKEMVSRMDETRKRK